MTNKIDCCNCWYWNPAEECCTVSDFLEYDEEQFFETCPQYEGSRGNGMTNDEVKKKIIETLKNTVLGYDCGHAIIARYFYMEKVFVKFADALIAAGIGASEEEE